MFATSTLIENVQLPHSAMHKEWKSELLSHLKRTRENVIIPNKHAIRSIKEIVKCGPLVIRKNGIYIDVAYNAEITSPCVGEVYEGKIKHIHSLYIMVEDSGVNVVIQPSNIPGYKFDKDKYTNGIHSYRINDKITFSILNVRYIENREIQCLAKHHIENVKVDEFVEPDMF